MKSVTLISSGERVSCFIIGKVTIVIIILYFNLNPSYMACTVYVYFSILNDDNFFLISTFGPRTYYQIHSCITLMCLQDIGFN